MSDLLRDLPPDLRETAGRVARELGRPVEQVVVEAIRTGLSLAALSARRDLSFMADTWDHDAGSDAVLESFRKPEPAVRP